MPSFSSLVHGPIGLLMASACSGGAPASDDTHSGDHAHGGAGHTHTGSDESSAGAGGAESDHCMAYEDGMSVTGSHHGWTVTLETATPAPPAKGLNRWVVNLTDPAGEAPSSDATLSVVPEMPEHLHGSTEPSLTKLDGGGWDVDALNFTMPGRWTVTFTIEDAGMMDAAVFSFCVDAD